MIPQAARQPLILASASPRRRELLTQAGFTFNVATSAIAEVQSPGEDPVAFTTRLAREKAEAVRTSYQASHPTGTPLALPLVLGADTVVVAPSGEILGKPADAADAARMLRSLAGLTHQVVTGVCLLSADRVETAAELTYVTMHTLSDAEIEAYISTSEPMDKAGAYAIQGYAARWIPRVQGCYFNVVGLPLALVTSMLQAASK